MILRNLLLTIGLLGITSGCLQQKQDDRLVGIERRCGQREFIGDLPFNIYILYQSHRHPIGGYFSDRALINQLQNYRILDQLLSKPNFKGVTIETLNQNEYVLSDSSQFSSAQKEFSSCLNNGKGDKKLEEEKCIGHLILSHDDFFHYYLLHSKHGKPIVGFEYRDEKSLNELIDRALISGDKEAIEETKVYRSFYAIDRAIKLGYKFRGDIGLVIGLGHKKYIDRYLENMPREIRPSCFSYVGCRSLNSVQDNDVPYIRNIMGDVNIF